jgi:hypothetical protein
VNGLIHEAPRIPLRDAAQRKSPAVSRQGFFFVAESGEISNLSLIEDIKKILEFISSKVFGK